MTGHPPDSKPARVVLISRKSVGKRGKPTSQGLTQSTRYNSDGNAKALVELDSSCDVGRLGLFQIFIVRPIRDKKLLVCVA